jgi:hypothetical protein
LLELEGMISDYTGLDIIVQTGVRARDEAKLITQIQDIRSESRKNEKKDNENQCCSFMRRSISSHDGLTGFFEKRYRQP